MADKIFHLELVTPRRMVFNGEVESFTAPGVVGSFQVLHSHAPLLAATGIGEVRIRDAGGGEQRYATSGGFVEVHDNKVIMLAETAERVDEIDVDRATAARDRARKRIVERQRGIDQDRARAALNRALNRLKIAGQD